MHIVHVFFHLKPEYIEEFKKASMENAQNSGKEAGVVSFDVLQQQDDSSKFIFVEIYQTPNDQIAHRETEHYKKWRQLTGDMMAETYKAIIYKNLISE